jgi:hypothetical protein
LHNGYIFEWEKTHTAADVPPGGTFAALHNGYIFDGKKLAQQQMSL